MSLIFGSRLIGIGGVVFSMALQPVFAASAKTEDTHDTAKSDANDEAMEKPVDPTVRIASSIKPLPFGPKQPWVLVRALQRMQDTLTTNHPNALGLYRQSLKITSSSILKQGSSIWQSERNLDAAALYVMIGGNPEVAKRALKQTNLAESQKHPLKAALAYATKDFQRAKKLFDKLDLNLLPLSLEPQFELAKAMLFSSTDIKATKKHLSAAMIQAPGTLIEEAALRRMIRVHGESKDFENLVRNSNTYSGRYNDSAYFNDYLRNYAFGIARAPESEEANAVVELEKLAGSIGGAEQLDIAVYLSRHAIVSGNMALANKASSIALEQLNEESKLRTRMTLYKLAAAMFLDDSKAMAIEMLKKVEPDHLGVEDRQLYSAVKALSARLSETLPMAKPPQTNAEKTKQSENMDNKTVTKARQLFAEFDALGVVDPTMKDGRNKTMSNDKVSR